MGTVVTFPIRYPGQDPEQYRRDGGLPINVSHPAVYTAEQAAYADEPKSLTNLQWSESQAEKGAEVKWCARDIRDEGSDQAMKYFFTAWTLYCAKETSGTMQVLNPRIIDIYWDKKAYFLGEEAQLKIKSFEVSNTSPTITVELWEEDEGNPDDFVLTQDVTVDGDEITANLIFDIDLISISDCDSDAEYKIYGIINNLPSDKSERTPSFELSNDFI